MLKYGERGFKTVAFEVCKHEPRCDVRLSKAVMEAFAANVKKTKEDPSKTPMTKEEFEIAIQLWDTFEDHAKCPDGRKLLSYMNLLIFF